MPDPRNLPNCPGLGKEAMNLRGDSTTATLVKQHNLYLQFTHRWVQSSPFIKEIALCIGHRTLLITTINQSTELWILDPDTSVIHLPHRRLREMGWGVGGVKRWRIRESVLRLYLVVMSEVKPMMSHQHDLPKCELNKDNTKRHGEGQRGKPLRPQPHTENRSSFQQRRPHHLAIQYQLVSLESIYIPVTLYRFTDVFMYLETHIQHMFLLYIIYIHKITEERIISAHCLENSVLHDGASVESERNRK